MPCPFSSTSSQHLYKLNWVMTNKVLHWKMAYTVTLFTQVTQEFITWLTCACVACPIKLALTSPKVHLKIKTSALLACFGSAGKRNTFWQVLTNDCPYYNYTRGWRVAVARSSYIGNCIFGYKRHSMCIIGKLEANFSNSVIVCCDFP